jgi:carbamoyl-phosphate synthase large subunit
MSDFGERRRRLAEPLALILEDGFAVVGDRGGRASQAEGELVFNTCMTGYQEVLSDPSYAGQMVAMTYPLIGNYGASPLFQESARPWTRALITRQLSRDAFHWRTVALLQEWLDAYKIPILTGVDTRRLVRHLRGTGAQRSLIAPVSRAYMVDELSESDEILALVERARAVTPLEDQDLVGEVSRAFVDLEETLDGAFHHMAMRQWPGMRIVVVDFGVKLNILRSLRARGVRVDIVRHNADVAEILGLRPDAVVLSNGPGDPARLQEAVVTTRTLLGRLPVLGICLGHQLIGLAAGGRTSRLRFGHHGGNHPVQHLTTGGVSITSQNHEFQVEESSIDEATGFFVSHRNLHDGSVEGLSHRSLPIRSVQFHPEGAPGPQDNQGVFDEFLDLISGRTPAPARISSLRPKPKNVLVIGSGPIVIGQAAEFDYAGTQACKALREEGVRTVLVNSNPATIMTDEEVADRVYIEPLTLQSLEAIIVRERPDALLATLGGQTGLNLAVALDEAGVLERFGVRFLGTSLQAIRKAEDRAAFKDLLLQIREPVPDSRAVSSVEEALAFVAEIGLPVVVRPSYCLGGTGAGTAHTPLELDDAVREGIAASPIGQVLVERALHGWKEIEYEVMRDAADTCIAVCNMENLDPLGIHTGDSIVVAPSQTLSDRQYQTLRSAAFRIIRALEIEGGCNIQFALDPGSDAYFVIEVNPRVSRSSALASKATGYPIARVAAKIAAGRLLHEIANAVTGKTCAAFEPALDYCVVKIPRWPFDKFPHADRTLGTQMKSTGEVMAIERTFEAALSKAMRSLEQAAPNAADLIGRADLLTQPNDRRLPATFQALRDGSSVAEISQATGYSPWFVSRISDLVELEMELESVHLDAELYRRAKRAGLADATVAVLSRQPIPGSGLQPTYRRVDTCAAEFEAATPYYYGTYEDEDEVDRSNVPSVVVIGSGPIRIGQGIEFDYCSVHASIAVQQAGFASVLVNSNPETVSTDFDASTRLYFEPLDEEGVLRVLQRERPAGVLVQFGGQTAINLAGAIAAAGIPILGSSVEAIDLAEDRHRCEQLLRALGIPRPAGGSATDTEQALKLAEGIGYPVVARPSYVLGGQAVEIVPSPIELRRYLEHAQSAGGRGPVLVDKYLAGRELDVDAVSDGEHVLIAGILEHIERAGVHSGDSFAVYPPFSLSTEDVQKVVSHTIAIARAFGLIGLINVQFVLHHGVVHVLEVNPRASRTVPFLSKVTAIPLVRLATMTALGRSLAAMGYGAGLVPDGRLVAVKAPVFSMAKLRGVDPVLGPEMKSTGEAMGIARDLVAAGQKAFLSSLESVPDGAALCCIDEVDRTDALPILTSLHRLGIRLFAPQTTFRWITQAGLPAVCLHDLHEGHPDAIDVIQSGRVRLVLNTVSANGWKPGAQPLPPDYEIRRAAVERRIPCVTSLDTARALVGGLDDRADLQVPGVATLGEYLSVTPPIATVTAVKDLVEV